MKTSPKILALVDLSALTPAVVRMAVDMARALHGKLILMHVGTPDVYADSDEWRTGVSRDEIAVKLRREHHALAAMGASARKKGVDATVLMVRSQSTRIVPIRKMLQEVDRLKPDLIVLGTGRHGALHALLQGSAANAVIKHAPCPIVLVPRSVRRRR